MSHPSAVLRRLAALLALSALLAGASSPASAQGPRGGAGAPAWSMQVLVDPAGELDVAAASAAAGRFEPAASNAPNLGFTEATVWLRLSLSVPAGEVWLLEVGYPLLDEIDLYVEHAPGEWRRQRAGDRLAFDERPIRSRVPVFELRPREHDTGVVYLRARTRGSMQIPISVWEARTFLQHATNEHLGLGIYFGMMLVMVLYNLVLFCFVRDSGYIYYVGFIASFAVMQMALNGLAFQYLWPEQSWWANHATAALPGITGIFGLAFARRVLNVRAVAPRLDRVMSWLTVVSVAQSAIALLGPYRLAASLSALLAVLFVMTVLPAACISVRKGYRPATYFLVAWMALLVGVLVTGLLVYGLLPRNALTANAMQVGSALEVFLLSLALADRINLMRAQKESAQREVFEMERRAKRDLEALVDARTAELREAKETAEVAARELEVSNRKLENLAARDPLTGLYNRRVFVEQLERAVGSTARSSHPVTVLLIDLDHFKHINDEHGHHVGDAVLRAVARVLEREPRANDLSARYGGEEFAVLLDGTGPEQGTLCAERLRAAIGSLRIEGRQEMRVSASIGVCGVTGPAHGLDVDALLRCADRALYDAKARGRDRVCDAGFDPAPTCLDTLPRLARA